MVERKSSFQIVANIFMVLLALCCIFPFALLVMSSLTEEKTLIQNGYSLFPAKFGLDSYACSRAAPASPGPTASRCSSPSPARSAAC